MRAATESIVDVFRRPVAEWVAVGSPVTEVAAEYRTLAIIRQLGTFPPPCNSTCPAAARVSERYYPRSGSGVFAAAIAGDADVACLLHGRLTCHVNGQSGDSPLHLDVTEPFLSCRGVCLTTQPDMRETLACVAQERGYSSPFWLSPDDVKVFSSYGGIAHTLGIRAAAENHHVMQRLYDPHGGLAVKVVNDRSQTTTVVNLQELQQTHRDPSTDRGPADLFMFRKFSPINVRTRAPFDFHIEDRLRVESICSRCWCSVWGTVDDFRESGIEPLPGALGINVLDAYGNSIFLTNALRTLDPLSAYAKAYPSRLIRFIR